MVTTDMTSIRQSRRQFVQAVGGLGLSLTGGALLASCGSLSSSIAPAMGPAPLETTRLRTFRATSVCHTPQFLAEPLLREEGFTDIQYVDPIPGRQGVDQLLDGQVDIMAWFSAPFIMRVDAGSPAVFLAGLHVGCFELFGTDQVRAIRDLKGKTVGTSGFGSVDHVFLSSMAAYVGLDPRVDINWLAYEGQRQPAQVLTDGQADALIGFPPIPQELRAKKIGHVVVNSATDKPWSQYFCCLIAGHQEFVQKNPVATKRALRAFLKADDLCAADPDRAAQYMVDNGYTQRLDYARQALHEIPYATWREYDPEDAVRFFSLRLQEIGMIKSGPDTIIQKGTNWRFLNELKQELKA